MMMMIFNRTTAGTVKRKRPPPPSLSSSLSSCCRCGSNSSCSRCRMFTQKERSFLFNTSFWRSKNAINNRISCYKDYSYSYFNSSMHERRIFHRHYTITSSSLIIRNLTTNISRVHIDGTTKRRIHNNDTNPDPNINANTTSNATSGTSSTSSSNNNGIFRLLNDTQRELLQQQQTFTTQVRSFARQVGLQGSSTSATLTSYSSNNSNNNTIIDDPNTIFVNNTFVVVFAGEYNAGKSTIINALMGTKLLETGTLPTTDSITILTNNRNNNYTDDTNTASSNSNIDINTTLNNGTTSVLKDHTQGEQMTASTTTKGSTTVGNRITTSTNSHIGDIMYYDVPNVPLLHDMTIVDTPGTNAVLTDHTTMTLKILPMADIIIFVTSADRPFPDSERTILESIAVTYRKQIIIVINKMDIFDTLGGDHGNIEKRRIVQYVSDHVSSVLGGQPMIIPISGRDALAAKVSGRVDIQQRNDSDKATSTFHDMFTNNDSVWNRSNFSSLERYLQETLTTETKIRSKLLSPIGIAEGILDQCKQHLLYNRNELETDIVTLNLVNSQFNSWKKELISNMNTTMNDIQSTLTNEGQRGIILLQRMNWKELYLSSLFDTSLLRREWEKTKSPLILQHIHSSRQYSDTHSTTSIDNSDTTIKHVVRNMISDMSNVVAVTSRAQGQTMIEFLGKRPAMKHQSLLGSITTASQYEDTRRQLNSSLNAIIDKNIDLNEIKLQESLLNRLQQLVWLSSGLHVGTVGVGLLHYIEIVDNLTGLSACSILLSSNALLWYIGRQNIVNQYASIWNTCCQRFNDDVQIVCTNETERVCRRILDGITPYTVFVETEQERFNKLLDQCDGYITTARQLRNRICK